VLFKEANLPRAAILAPICGASGCLTMTLLPGTPQLVNIIPSQFFGTPMTAAPVFSIILSAIAVALTLVYFRFAEKTARNKGEKFSFPPGYDESMVNIDKSGLPHPIKAFIPIVVLILFIIISTGVKAPYSKDTALLATLAMLIASILVIILNPKKLSLTMIKNLVGDGANNGFSAIIGLAAVVAFGGVVSSAPAFQSVVKWVLGLDMNVYVKGIVSTAVIAGITGSATGGVRIMLQNLAEYFLSSGCNMEVLHRLVTIAAGTLDSLPHTSSIFLVFALMKLTHKDAYKYYFWTTVAIPSVIVIIGAIIAIIAF
jgi:H+/gluconate symporter-like permease